MMTSARSAPLFVSASRLVPCAIVCAMRAARLPDDARIEVVEEEIERAAVHGDRRQHVAAAGEREQADAVARAERAQPTDLLLHALEAVRPLVRRQHRERRIDGEHEVDAGRSHRRALQSPARTGEGDTSEQRGRAEPHGAPSAAHAEHGRRHESAHDVEACPGARAAACALRARAPQQEHEARAAARCARISSQGSSTHVVQHGEQRHHGSGPFHATSSSSAARRSA